ncbi:hypothetical protein AB4Y89_19120 [Terriglobus sp. 2YAB30_2]|uniref:hypothetical protein n=1 Tax=Terriglobus sp. 2YAB30_2 TaxID=3233023 RepID=UPI003F95EBB0
MRFQLEIKDASDGLTVRAVYPPNRQTVFLCLAPAALTFLLLLLFSEPNDRPVCLAALIPLGLGLCPAWRRWFGVDAMFRISGDGFICRQPYAESREVSYSLANISDISYWRPWRRYGIAGLYAFERGINPMRASVCLIPHLNFSQCMEITVATRRCLFSKRQQLLRSRKKLKQTMEG